MKAKSTRRKFIRQLGGTGLLLAAAPTLACNDSYFQKKIINWDPVNMKVI